MRRHGNRILVSVGVLMVLCGVYLLRVDEERHDDQYEEIRRIAESSVIVVDKDRGTGLGGDLVSSDRDWVYDNVSEDQDLEQVVSYQNVLEIPQYDILAYIYPDTDWSSLSKGVGHYSTTAGIGELGNCVVAGHSSATYRCILNEIANMDILDTFFVYDNDGERHQYYVTEKRVVAPSNITVLDTLDVTISQFTMVTCTKNGTERLVVEGKEFDETQLLKFIEDRNRARVGRVRAVNQEVEVLDLCNIFLSRGVIDHVTHDFNFAGSILGRGDVDSIRVNLNSIRKEELKIRDHVYTLDFDLHCGVMLKED